MDNPDNKQTHEPIDGLDTPAIVTAGFVAAIGTFTLIVALQAVYLYYKDSRRESDARANSGADAVSKIAEQRAKLHRYGWIDRSSGTVAIPIDRAIELTARALGQKTAAAPGSYVAEPGRPGAAVKPSPQHDGNDARKNRN